MTPPKIPKGWIKLRKGMIIKLGDRFFCCFPGGWELTECAGERVGYDLTYIRKAKAPKP